MDYSAQTIATRIQKEGFTFRAQSFRVLGFRVSGFRLLGFYCFGVQRRLKKQGFMWQVLAAIVALASEANFQAD